MFVPLQAPKLLLNSFFYLWIAARTGNYLDFEKAYDTVWREIFCNILTEFGTRMKLVRLIKMCLNETYRKVRIGKIMYDVFPIHSGQNKEMFYCHCFSTLL
jgi:hypothetical protein